MQGLKLFKPEADKGRVLSKFREDEVKYWLVNDEQVVDLNPPFFMLTRL